MSHIENPTVVPLGSLYATPKALQCLENAGISPCQILGRHALGDWGDVCEEDKRANDRALRMEERILSAYVLPVTRVKLWIITEYDRSMTAILLPDEY